MATFCFQCITSFLWDEKTEKLDQPQIWQGGLFLGPDFKFIKNFHVGRHFVTSVDYTFTAEAEKVYDVIMKSFLNQNN